jgi:hypothetical protein
MKKHRTKVPDFSSAPKGQPRPGNAAVPVVGKQPPRAPVAPTVKPQATSSKSGRRGG